jgi:hypothetical protein
MSDLEYDVLDELYFVQSFDHLKDTLQWDDRMLRETIEKLLQRDWLRCYATPTDELFGDEIDLETNYHTYFYLASKSGLFAHNSSDQNV